jgi:hypothetical protein
MATLPSCFGSLQWLEIDSCCLQTAEALNEKKNITVSNGCKTIKAVIRSAYCEGKTLNLAYMLPAHSVIVQALLNMNPSSIKHLYEVTTRLNTCETMTLKQVVSKELSPFLLNMTLSKFKATVELLYYLKEYFLSLFGVALVNVTCSDRSDVLIILSQNTLTCNLCDKSAESTRLFQCIECNVSSICVDCMQHERGASYLMAHTFSCKSIQNLIKPIVETMTFAHLCSQCFTPLHRRYKKNHFNPDVSFSDRKSCHKFVYKKARCTVPSCKRDLCVNCLRKSNSKKVD